MSDEPEIGDLVKTESGNIYPVVGREQGGRTRLLPSGPGGATREFWPENLEVFKKDVNLLAAYQAGLQNAPTEDEVADAIAALALEGFIPAASLPRLHRVIDSDTAAAVGDKMEGGQ